MPATLRLAVVLLASCALLAGCGPASPTEAGGEAVDPVDTLTILPSPGTLRGAPAAEVDAAGLQRALTGEDDPELAETLRGRDMRAAAVRSWRSPQGGELVAVVSVWGSHLLATGVGGQAAERLLSRSGARAWTPSGLGGARGARMDAGGRSERRLAYAVGPNSVYVRATGPVDDATVARAAGRLIRHVQAVG